jgi:hypothetical protein
MKCFKKWGIWVLYSFIVVLGFLFILHFNLQSKSSLIPDVNAQIHISYSSFMSPHSGLIHTFPGITDSYGVSMGGLAYSYPADFGETIFTCGIGCNVTRSTCIWDCGSRGPTGPKIPSPSETFLTGSCGGNTSTTCTGLFGSCVGASSTFGICTGTGFTTLMTCSGGIFCGGDGNTTYMTCGGSLFGGCGGIGGGYTSSTCTFTYGYKVPSRETCGCNPEWKSEPSGGFYPYQEEATRWQSCGNWIMHGNPGLTPPVEFSAPPAL